MEKKKKSGGKPGAKSKAKSKAKSSKKMGGWIGEHKKLSLIIASAFLILCVAAIIVIVTLVNRTPSDNDSGRPSFNPITRNADEVVYYYSVVNEDKEILLTFKRGWNFNLEGSNVDGVNKSGEYTVNDNVITLDFVRDKDGTATATIKNANELSVMLNGVPTTFRKKVNFTVSFMNSDGSAIYTESVLNGKTLTAPAAPTRENYDFGGWYADAGCTAEFNFGNPITKNTTVYAKWTPNQSAP